VARSVVSSTDDDPAELPVHRWVEDHALDLFEGPEPSDWRPEGTNWVKELLQWAEQDAQERDRESEENWPHELVGFRNRRKHRYVRPPLSVGRERAYEPFSRQSPVGNADSA